MKGIAHSLSGAGGIFGFPAISDRADALARAVDAMLAGTGALAEIERALDALLCEIAHE
jgi:hypothetical protein